MNRVLHDYAPRLRHLQRLDRADDAAEFATRTAVRTGIALVLALLLGAWIGARDTEARLLQQFARVQVETMESNHD